MCNEEILSVREEKVKVFSIDTAFFRRIKTVLIIHNYQIIVDKRFRSSNFKKIVKVFFHVN